MSLLINYKDPKFLDITKTIYEEQFKRDPKLNIELNDRRKKLMYDDISYNMSYLLTSIHFNDEKIFENYALWLYKLLCNLMKDLDRDRIMEHMVDHYRIMAEIIEDKLKDLLTKEEIEKAKTFLNAGIRVTENAVVDVPLSHDFSIGRYGNTRKAYLESLLRNDTREAHRIVMEEKESGTPLIDIYEDILARAMYEVGELWHKNEITINKEHYVTSVTQNIMSKFYDDIFSRPRNGKTLLSCAVGSELHEIGIRMVSDIFECNGWDTYYLGAALPKDEIISAIEEYKPDLLALSVTMPNYLDVCEKIVLEVKRIYPELAISVGGGAFLSTDNLWKKWDIDHYSESARELINWAHGRFIK